MITFVKAELCPFDIIGVNRSKFDANVIKIDGARTVITGDKRGGQANVLTHIAHIICATPCIVLDRVTAGSISVIVGNIKLPVICHMGSHSVTCHPTEVILMPLPRHIANTHLSTPEG